MDDEGLSKEWAIFLLLIFLILIIQFVYFLKSFNEGFFFLLFLLFCLFLFIFWNNNTEKEKLDTLLKQRENPTKYLFFEIPKEFP